MWNRVIRSLSLHVILLIFAVVSVVSGISLVRSAMQISHDRAEVAVRLAGLVSEKKRIEEEIRERTQEESVRYQAHLRLNLKNPGENIVVVLPEKYASSADEKSDSFWQSIKNFFRAITGGR